MVEATLAPGSSIARVAREHGVNANQLFYWRKLCPQGCLVERRVSEVKLLPDHIPLHHYRKCPLALVVGGSRVRERHCCRFLP
jgi:transposase-like protein